MKQWSITQDGFFIRTPDTYIDLKDVSGITFEEGNQITFWTVGTCICDQVASLTEADKKEITAKWMLQKRLVK
jgi:hypothetical protein